MVLIHFEEIELVEFKQSAGRQGSTHNFNLSMTINSIPDSKVATKEYTFSGFDELNYAALFSFLSGKNIHIAINKGVGIGTDDHADKLHRYQKEHQLAKIAFKYANTHLVNAKAVLDWENVAFEHAKTHLANAKAVLN